MTQVALQDGTLVDLRVASPDDIPLLIELCATVYANRLDDERPRTDMENGHVVIAFVGDCPVAFRSQRGIGSDILSYGLMVVIPELQNRGVGRAVVDFFEQTVADKWHTSLLVNSDGYPTVSQKPDATGFWESCGYERLLDTPESRVLVKRLR